MNQEEKLLSAIFNVGGLIRKKIHESNCLEDFTRTEIEILKLLNDKKSRTMKFIAGYLHIKPSSATPVVDGLVKRGNLKRTQSKDDRRVVYIEITFRGLKSLQEKYKNIHKTIRNVFGKLSDKDKKNLIKIFNRLNNFTK